MQEKSRILVFTTAYRPMIGGSEIALEEMIRRLPDIFFDIVTPRHSKEYKPLEVGGNFCIHRVGPGFESAKIFFPVLGFIKARQLMKSNKYDAVHAYQASQGGGAAWLVKLFSPRLPFILTMQEGKKLDGQLFLLNWLRGLIIKKADMVTVISNYLKEYVQKVSKNKSIFLIPNGVDLKNFPISIRQPADQFPITEKRKTIITVSRLVPKNGLGDLIKAFRILNTKYKIQDTKLLIIGDGKQREELFNLASGLGLKDRVEFAGSVPNVELQEYLSSASIFVRPSLSEGLGIAFLEAMAAGLPIVATPVGGIPDFLKDPSTHSGQATGLFCKVNDPEDIAEKINRILTDDDLRNRLILNGRKLVEEKYTWDKIADQFKNLYDSI
ncbi:MAG: hypothetical protein A2655_02070 [Candidatus Yanofskybacteria bacterium RIFCSPHIGHO2_01_FULL_43_42]|uniref:Glycosyl transferase family 1 domain-containing protein n=1 Tax=Candidatus Yanofskybacteria bacterium RIFCSPLOWO2_01_FULL_43_22 TaxID=1802695 RepID=A0A1F8GH93_9BACT|nr:MAG: hypothetical protein A2655_02070 [Candidatus Yanofskybacteria bacterium RIFCSPHIGHO2_01_FULL_43_42]OGN13255.1 MAG: hypothetical protein A3D48_02975 [Candidatus Yanofskybacteria bacterium RIFCSPHIGHO2_02_FULL_43_17]OGN24671.1 MAG: hypothetical protein A3A13_01200 [Candidatus Yanofskybacteria bacterium RIFCSPLOWO2_01_FULL_43_22]